MANATDLLIQIKKLKVLKLYYLPTKPSNYTIQFELVCVATAKFGICSRKRFTRP